MWMSKKQSTRNAPLNCRTLRADDPGLPGGRSLCFDDTKTRHWFHGRTEAGDHGYPPPRTGSCKCSRRCNQSKRSRPIPDRIITLAPSPSRSALAEEPEIVPKSAAASSWRRSLLEGVHASREYNIGLILKRRVCHVKRPSGGTCCGISAVEVRRRKNDIRDDQKFNTISPFLSNATAMPAPTGQTGKTHRASDRRYMSVLA